MQCTFFAHNFLEVSSLWKRGVLKGGWGGFWVPGGEHNKVKRRRKGRGLGRSLPQAKYVCVWAWFSTPNPEAPPQTTPLPTTLSRSHFSFSLVLAFVSGKCGNKKDNVTVILRKTETKAGDGYGLRLAWGGLRCGGKCLKYFCGKGGNLGNNKMWLK